MKVVHLTSAHPRFDTRIFVKECQSLAKKYEVHLIVADGKGNEIKNEVHIHDVGKATGRMDRMRKVTKKVFSKAKTIDANLYHFHDPELMPIALKLKKNGKKVIMDAHEDLPRQLLAKPYLNTFTSKMLSSLAERYEDKVARKMDGIVTATPFIRDRFLKHNKKTVDVNNFPIIKELLKEKSWNIPLDNVCYVGGLSKVRGIKEIVESLQFLKKPVQLLLAGSFAQADFYKEVQSIPSWNKIEELGYLDRQGVLDVYKKAAVGIVTLHPIINYLDALPVKMFEYMAAGLPVISSNFPLWKDILKNADAGICVDPLNPKEIAAAIDSITSNPKWAQEMGLNGQKAVREIYNWSNEEKKLLKLYEDILS